MLSLLHALFLLTRSRYGGARRYSIERADAGKRNHREYLGYSNQRDTVPRVIESKRVSRVHVLVITKITFRGYFKDVLGMC